MRSRVCFEGMRKKFLNCSADFHLNKCKKRNECEENKEMKNYYGACAAGTNLWRNTQTPHFINQLLYNITFVLFSLDERMTEIYFIFSSSTPSENA